MVIKISISDYFKEKFPLPLVDVRSPGEFKKGHVPHAVNIPLFTNDERAHVGTVYVQQSREEAIEVGYKYVNPRLEWFIAESKKAANGKLEIAVHCWRGGMRSLSFAEHLSANGFEKVYLIEGGYKAFRNHVLRFFEQPFNLRILGGYTGSGKTYILHELEALGQQVVDLEGIAHHKGSAFGSIGESEQPSVEHFENLLFFRMRTLDATQPIWLEDESHSIGYVKIPMPFFKQMRVQTVYFVDIPKEIRAKHLVGEYANFGNKVLQKGIDGIAKRLGGQNVKLAHEKLAENNYFDVAVIALQYYDRAYKRGLSNRDMETVFSLPLAEMDHKKNAQSILNFALENERNQTHTI